MAENKPKSKSGFSARMFEIMQRVEFLTEEKIKEVIAKYNIIVEWCYMLHDKDLKEDGTPKPPHWHIFIRTESPHYAGQIAQWFGVEMQYVNKIKSRYETGALYCIHKHDQNKHQYDPREVRANFDYLALCEKDDNKSNNKKRLEEIVNGIMSGTIREFNLYNNISIWDYIKHKAKIDNAFEYRRNIKAEEQRDKQVVFIQGEAGVGKTTYAKKLAQDKGWSFCVAGASNDPLENYKGQDVLILDDLRGSSQRLEDLLKMLDNNTNSLAKARYHNKVLECQMIIITTSEEIGTFFCQVFQDHPESIIQLKRRCQTYIEMTRDEIFVSMYDETLRDYRPVAHIENPIRYDHPVEELTEQKIEERLAFLFGDDIKKIEAPTATGTAEASTPLTDDIVAFFEGEVKDFDCFF